MTNHKKLIDVTESLDRNYLSFTKEEVYLKSISLQKGRDLGLVWKLHAPTHRLLQ